MPDDATPPRAPGAPDAAPPGHGWLRVGQSLSIPLSEIEVRTSTSGGPGGQHANRTESRVEVRFDVVRSRALAPHQRARLLQRLGPVVRAGASDERSQYRNRELALGRLAATLARGLHREVPRVETRPTRASRTRRLEEKRRQAERKARRRPPADDA